MRYVRAVVTIVSVIRFTEFVHGTWWTGRFVMFGSEKKRGWVGC